MEHLFKIQKSFNQKLYGKEISKKEQAEITKTLSLCLHSEVSELMQSVTFKDHHIQTDKIDKVKMLFESVDVIRYVIAMLNLNDISSHNFLQAYLDKDVYLNNIEKDQKSWDGIQKVAIIDIDDVLSEFRSHFAIHLNNEYELYPDVDSEEYYFITALSKLDMNPEAVFEKFTDQGGFRDIPVVPGAIEMLNDIRNKGYWIQLLTARPKENLRCFYDTYYWLDNNNIPKECGLNFSLNLDNKKIDASISIKKIQKSNDTLSEFSVNATIPIKFADLETVSSKISQIITTRNSNRENFSISSITNQDKMSFFFQELLIGGGILNINNDKHEIIGPIDSKVRLEYLFCTGEMFLPNYKSNNE